MTHSLLLWWQRDRSDRWESHHRMEQTQTSPICSDRLCPEVGYLRKITRWSLADPCWDMLSQWQLTEEYLRLKYLMQETLNWGA